MQGHFPPQHEHREIEPDRSEARRNGPIESQQVCAPGSLEQDLIVRGLESSRARGCHSHRGDSTLVGAVTPPKDPRGQTVSYKFFQVHLKEQGGKKQKIIEVVFETPTRPKTSIL